MSLTRRVEEAIEAAGPKPGNDAPRKDKKN